MKETKDGLNKWKIGKLNIVKMSVFPKLIYKFSAIPIKITRRYFESIDFKLYIKREKTQKSQHQIEEETQVGGMKLSDLKIYNKATVIKTTCWF